MMGDLGFWALAQEDPDHLALVAPDGTELSAGGLLGRANQVVHALRGFDLKPGDVVATVLPNCAEMFEVYLAALQAGWYLVPINHHLVASEIAYILSDSGPKASSAPSRSPTPVSTRPTRPRSPGRPAWPSARSSASTPMHGCATSSPPPSPRAAPSAT